VSSGVPILCTVRGCGSPLARGERRWSCARGHSFDVARRGYVNLLQPQDRRSTAAGDSLAATAARRRLAEAGHLAPLARGLAGLLARREPLAGAAWLDVGAGDGWLFGELLRGREVEAHALDLSAPAVDFAARRLPGATWLVANADRGLPYADRSFGLVLSITSRWTFTEMARVLAPEGTLLFAVAGADDLEELRALIHGAAPEKPRLERALSEAGEFFAVVATATIRWRVELEARELADLLAASYRGARRSVGERLAGVDRLAVTMSRDAACLVPR